MEADEERERAASTDARRREVEAHRLEGVDGARMDFLCECSNPTCRELVSITLDECEFVRRVPDRLVLKVGHADHASERVLMEEPGRFEVVERFESSDDVVAHLASWAPGASNHTGRAA